MVKDNNNYVSDHEAVVFCRLRLSILVLASTSYLNIGTGLTDNYSVKWGSPRLTQAKRVTIHKQEFDPMTLKASYFLAMCKQVSSQSTN